MELELFPLTVSTFVPGPRMFTLAVINGRLVASVMTPVTLENVMAPPPPPLASRMAWRNEPEPASWLLLTVKVAAESSAATKAVTPITAQIFLRYDFNILISMLWHCPCLCNSTAYIQAERWFS